MVRPIDISGVVNSLQYLGQSNARYAELERREKEKKSSLGSQLGGIAGGIIGSYYGGPVGGAAGAAAGSAIGAKLAGGRASGQQVAQSGYQGYQMGQNSQQQEQNKKFNNMYADSIDSDPNATQQQKQFSGYIRNSSQDYTKTASQGQYLGIDPKSMQQQSINKDANNRAVEAGITALKSRQENLSTPSATYQTDYQDLQRRIDRLESLKNNPNFGKLKNDTVQLEVKRQVPKNTEVYERQGKILSRETDPLTGEVKIKSLGNVPKNQEGLYQVPYYDKDGNPRVNTYTDKQKAIDFANEQGTGILDKDKSIFLDTLKSNLKSDEKTSDYKITQDLIKRKDAISRRLTKKDITGQTVPPKESEVDALWRDELKTMLKTTSGKEKKVIMKQYKAIDEKIKTQESEKILTDTTNAFVAQLPAISPNLEATKANIEYIKNSGPPENVDREKALAALERLKSQQEQVEKQEEEAKIAEEEKKKRLVTGENLRNAPLVFSY